MAHYRPVPGTASSSRRVVIAIHRERVASTPLVRSGCLLILAGIFLTAGCGQAQPEEALEGRSLNHAVLQLDQGASIESVENQLGQPRRVDAEGDRTSLSYGIWQLSFVDEHLTMRSKVVNPKGSRPIKGSRDLNQLVRRLRLGMNVGVVMKHLGIPETLYIIYGVEPAPVEVLRYGTWELTFVDRKLTQRAQ